MLLIGKFKFAVADDQVSLRREGKISTYSYIHKDYRAALKSSTTLHVSILRSNISQLPWSALLRELPGTSILEWWGCEDASGMPGVL